MQKTSNNLNQAFIGLGANLGNTNATLKSAIDDLKNNNKINLVKVSSFYSSKPVDADGPDYTNAVALIETRLNPQQLLQVTQTIENHNGRTRLYHNAPRTLDLDILLFGNLNIDEKNLVIPHPRMHLRAFVLLPLLEIAPNIILPQGDKNILLANIKDQKIYKIN